MNVVWSPRARDDLRDIRKYLQQHSPRAARRIMARIIGRVADQRDMPYAAPFERGGPERCLVVSKTPYLVLYSVSGDTLTVNAVFHSMRNC
ncbi:type II toxin-antitoxin system RelE/ParE family toxin [Vitreimonas sp.]|uniref:type II toxin-antitoxin system RelE/ParE family toxin n=1 Tax=Vitreimonas sp. TaxID=3069702 RepID=UPI0039C8EBA0